MPRRPRRPLKKTLTPIKSCHPLIAERFRCVLSHTGTGPINLGIPPIGTLRPLLGDFSDASKSPVLCDFWAYDRTVSEWIDLISDYRYKFSNNSWPAFIQRPTSSIFDRKDKATEIETLFLKNQRMRWICRKFIARLRKRVMDKRAVGDTDLFTMCPIPDNQCIRVYDTMTRCVYFFHAHTMSKLIIRALLYGTYGIADPQSPKNPYTNIEWNIWQLISITNQLLLTGAQHCKPIPFVLLLFRKCNFNINYFFEKNASFLQIEAAVHFFEDLEYAEAKEIFFETYDDLCSYIDGHLSPLRNRRIRSILEETKDKELMKQWTTLITSFWIYNNHKIMWKWLDMLELTVYYHRLQRETLAKYTPTISVNTNLYVDGIPNPQTEAGSV
jgi:hypothetical protein